MTLWLLICIHLNICIDPVQSKKGGSAQLCAVCFKGISVYVSKAYLLTSQKTACFVNNCINHYKIFR